MHICFTCIYNVTYICNPTLHHKFVAKKQGELHPNSDDSLNAGLVFWIAGLRIHICSPERLRPDKHDPYCKEKKTSKCRIERDVIKICVNSQIHWKTEAKQALHRNVFFGGLRQHFFVQILRVQALPSRQSRDQLIAWLRNRGFRTWQFLGRNLSEKTRQVGTNRQHKLLASDFRAP